MNRFNGTLEEFHAEVKRLSEKHWTTDTLARCYLSNYGSEYMCSYCARIDFCKRIREGEGK